MTRIAFCGKAGSGKTSAAKYLQQKHGGVVLSFSSSLKEKAFWFGWDGKKDLRGRTFLQRLGQVVREYEQDYWANQVRTEVEFGYAGEHNQNLFLDDLRFANEVDILRAMGFKLVYLDAFGLPDAGAAWRNDVSEQFDHQHADYRIRSSIGCMDEFERNLDSVWDLLADEEAFVLGG
jgi:hypothetical protein